MIAIKKTIKMNSTQIIYKAERWPVFSIPLTRRLLPVGLNLDSTASTRCSSLLSKAISLLHVTVDLHAYFDALTPSVLLGYLRSSYQRMPMLRRTNHLLHHLDFCLLGMLR